MNLKKLVHGVPGRPLIPNQSQRLIEILLKFWDSKYRSSLEIKKADLPQVLTAIYNARSAYLHAGEPMYLSMPIKGGERWDIDPTLGMTIDNREFSPRPKLPYAYFFEGLVRHCLLSYLETNSLP
jgi:hypothetical protein